MSEERTDYNHPSARSLRSALAAAALLGRGSDSMLVHVNPREAEMLRKSGGSGARNPLTGLMEFDGGGDNYSPPTPSYGPGSGSGLYAWGSSVGSTNDVPSITGFGNNTFPGALTATSPTDFTPLAAGASVPSYVTSDQGRATELAAQQSGGAGFDVGTPTLGTFNVNGQQNYGFQFGNGLFAPAFMPTSGEIPTSLDATGESALYPAPLAGATLQNQAGLPAAWTVGPDGSLVPTAQAQSDARYNLPNELKALADTGPSTLQQLLGVAGPIGMFAGGAFLGPLLGLGGEAAGAAGEGAGAAGAAAAGGVDLASLGIDPTTAALLGIGGDTAIPGFSAGGAGLGAAAGAAAGAASDVGGLFDLNTLLGLDPATTAALTTGDVSGLAGGAGGFAGGAGATTGNFGLPSLTDSNPFIGVTDSTPVTAGSDLPLTAPAVSAPSNLGGAEGFIDTGSFDVPTAGGGGGGGFLSNITDPINKFVNSNSGLLKALGLGASALSLGKDLMGNNSPTALTGGSQLDALAKQLAQPGGINPTQTAKLQSLQDTATTQNQGQVQTLTNLQGQAAASGNTLQNYLNTGTLPPAVQSAVDQATQAAITSIKAGYAGRGIPANSSMEIQDINTAKQNATAKAAELMQSLSAQGLSEQQLAASIGQQITGTNTQGTQLAGQIGTQLLNSGLTSAGISEAIYQSLLQADQNQQTQTGNAIARLAAALAGGNTIKLGGTTAI